MNDTMTMPATKPEFMLLFRNTDYEGHHGLSTDTLKEAMDRLNMWIARWSEAGALVGGQPLAMTGKVISGTKQRMIADGPFAEAKEAIGGYAKVRAADLEEAMKIAADWPLLDYGGVIEVRPLLEECPVMEKVGSKLHRLIEA